MCNLVQLDGIDGGCWAEVCMNNLGDFCVILIHDR